MKTRAEPNSTRSRPGDPAVRPSAELVLRGVAESFGMIPESTSKVSQEDYSCLDMAFPD
jgi:hypothetical protein